MSTAAYTIRSGSERSGGQTQGSAPTFRNAAVLGLSRYTLISAARVRLPQYIQVTAVHGGCARVIRKATTGAVFRSAATQSTWSTPGHAERMSTPVHVVHVLIVCGWEQPFTAQACPPPAASRPPPPAGDTRTRPPRGFGAAHLPSLAEMSERVGPSGKTQYNLSFAGGAEPCADEDVGAPRVPVLRERG